MLRTMAIRPVRTSSTMPNGPHQVDERFDLLFLAGDFDDHLIVGDVDDPAAEDLGQLADLRAACRRLPAL